MSIKHYRVKLYWSGHSTQGGSTGKEWAALLAQAVTEDEPGGEGNDQWIFMAVFGKTGMGYQGGRENPQLVAMADAERSFNKMVREKASAAKGYQRTSGNVDVGEGATGPQGFAEFLPYFRIPLVMPDEEGGGEEGARVVFASSTPVAKRPTLGYAACDVKPVDMPQLLLLMENPRYGVGQKVDGRRRFVRNNGQRLIGYNKSGVEQPAIPEAWSALEQLRCTFVLDGEQLPIGRGLYAIFEPLEWRDEDVRGMAYQVKHHALEEAMIAAGLIKGAGATLRQAMENSLVEGIALLSVSRGALQAQEVLAHVQETQAEGVVVRLLDGSYDGPRSVQKWKAYTTVECVAVGINREGKVVGSVRLAMVRESDGALVEVCCVRSGLSPVEVEALAREIEVARESQGAPVDERKRYPVLEVSFLLPSTISYPLVQPAFVRSRDDKLPEECTFGQFLDLFVEGREKRAAEIEAAEAIEGVALSSL
jgi:hypothetical protein